LNNEGYAKTTTKYDQHGNKVEWACFGLRDEPKIDQSLGNHMVKYTYDERGNTIAWEFYGVDGKLCLVKYGYAKMTAKYDERGNQVEWACFGLYSEPTIHQIWGYHIWKATYNERGCQISGEYAGIDGKPRVVKTGCAKFTAKFDERGRQIEEACFDESGIPIAKNGIARYDTNFDEKGNAAMVWYFDRDGKRTEGQVYADEVFPGGQAAAAGLLAGDVLISYDGRAIIYLPELIAWVRTGGASRELVVSRRGRCIRFRMKPGVMGIFLAVRAAAVPAF
jgi:PDZ domain